MKSLNVIPRMSSIDFMLSEARPGGYVTGRNCGVDLPVGTVFTAVVRRVYTPREPYGEVLVVEPEFVAAVSLRLDSAEAYRHHLDPLDSGLTALLGLSGTGFEIISELLAHAPPRTYYSLVVHGPISSQPPHLGFSGWDRS